MQVFIQFQQFFVNFKTYRVELRDHLYFHISIILSLFSISQEIRIKVLVSLDQ